jgi:hypothetical protein
MGFVTIYLFEKSVAIKTKCKKLRTFLFGVFCLQRSGTLPNNSHEQKDARDSRIIK